jgi:hypothetical protein
MKYRKTIAVVLGVLIGIGCSNYRHPSTQQSSIDAPPSPKRLTPAPQTAATTLGTSDQQGETKVLDALGLSRLQAYVLELQERYIATEGRANRGDTFADLASKLDYFQPPPREFEVLELLGAPDFFYIAPLGSEFLYVYSSQTKKYLITIQFTEKHIFRQILWGGTYSYALPWKWSLFLGPSSARALPGPDAGYIGTRMEMEAAPDNSRLIVKEVVPGSPAALAGIMRADVLLTADGKPIPKDPGEFVELISHMKPGSVVAIVLRRSKAQGVADMTVRVTLGRRGDKQSRIKIMRPRGH